MSWVSTLQIGSAGLLLAGSALGLLRLLWIRETPVLRRARLLACLCLLLLGFALLTAGPHRLIWTLMLALAGTGCGIAWLTILYVNSLHNTTM